MYISILLCIIYIYIYLFYILWWIFCEYMGLLFDCRLGLWKYSYGYGFNKSFALHVDSVMTGKVEVLETDRQTASLVESLS